MMDIIGLNQTCEILRQHGMKAYPEKIGAGLQQGVYNFGTAVKLREWTYDIYKPLLMDWIRARSGEEPEVK